MHTHLMMPFQMTPKVNDLVALTLTFMLKIAFSDFVVPRGIVLHKHMYIYTRNVWGEFYFRVFANLREFTQNWSPQG